MKPSNPQTAFPETWINRSVLPVFCLIFLFKWLLGYIPFSCLEFFFFFLFWFPLPHTENFQLFLPYSSYWNFSSHIVKFLFRREMHKGFILFPPWFCNTLGINFWPFFFLDLFITLWWWNGNLLVMFYLYLAGRNGWRRRCSCTFLTCEISNTDYICLFLLYNSSI